MNLSHKVQSHISPSRAPRRSSYCDVARFGQSSIFDCILITPVIQRGTVLGQQLSTWIILVDQVIRTSSTRFSGTLFVPCCVLKVQLTEGYTACPKAIPDITYTTPPNHHCTTQHHIHHAPDILGAHCRVSRRYPLAINCDDFYAQRSCI